MKLGGLALGGQTPVVCAVMVGSIRTTGLNKAIKSGVGMLEIRLDTFKNIDTEAIKKDLLALRAKGLPLLLTVRSVKEGAQDRLSDTERLDLFLELTAFVDAIDIELSSKKILAPVVSEARRQGKKVIVSYHNFKATPERKKLLEIIKEGCTSGADIVKIAVNVKNRAGLKRLAALLIENTNLIVIAMGDAGSASRVFFPMLGSLITYAGLAGTNAPGQLTLAALDREFRLFGFK